MEIDLDEDKNVAGIRIQPRDGITGQRVTSFKITCFKNGVSDGVLIDNDNIFTVTYTIMNQDIYFSHPVIARKVRIYP